MQSDVTKNTVLPFAIVCQTAKRCDFFYIMSIILFAVTQETPELRYFA
jgi:heme/copper-type cytochrome/quinol oxidase subunit 4